MHWIGITPERLDELPGWRTTGSDEMTRPGKENAVQLYSTVFQTGGVSMGMPLSESTGQPHPHLRPFGGVASNGAADACFSMAPAIQVFCPPGSPMQITPLPSAYRTKSCMSTGQSVGWPASRRRRKHTQLAMQYVMRKKTASVESRPTPRQPPPGQSQ